MASAKNRTAGAPAVAFDPASIVLTKQLVFPTLQTRPGVPIYIKVLEPMFVGQQLEQDVGADGKPTRGPATIIKAHCFDGGAVDGKAHPLNGKDVQIVANKLLVKRLEENYPSQGYVGKCFMVTKATSKKKGKGAGDGYFEFELFEFADPTA